MDANTNWQIQYNQIILHKLVAAISDIGLGKKLVHLE